MSFAMHITIIVVLVAAAFQARAVGQDQPTTAAVPLRQVLEDVARQANVQFTLEMDCRGVGRTPLHAGKLPNMDRSAKVQDVIRHLQNALKGVSVLAERGESRVIHLVDDSLVKDEVYPLNQPISVKFTGTTFGLIQAVGDMMRNAIIAADLDPDVATPSVDMEAVSVEASNMPVRGVLTVFQPLERYGAIVWEAEYYRRGEVDVVGIRYAPKVDLPLGASDHAAPRSANIEAGHDRH